jgi:hypothetical protein
VAVVEEPVAVVEPVVTQQPAIIPPQSLAQGLFSMLGFRKRRTSMFQ